MARLNSHADLAPFVCDRCCMPVEDVTSVVTEPGYGGDRDQPAYDATVEGWCAACLKTGKHHGETAQDPRERGDDDGVEYGHPSDYMNGVE